jgi:hypothetical protein
VKTWRLAAGHTHLYPGARLRYLEPHGECRMRSGDAAIIEFTDGHMAQAEVTVGPPLGIEISVAAHATARGARLAAKQWRLAPSDVAGVMKVLGRG